VGRATGLRFEALGVLRVRADSEIAVTRPARRRVLSILLLERGRVVPATRLIDRMWGDSPPRDPRNAMQAHVAGLRRQLGSVIESALDGYRLDLDTHCFDVDEFVRLADDAERAAKHGVPEETEAFAAAALELWRGDPFPDLDGDEYARGPTEALIETRVHTETRRLDALLAVGRAEEALPELERLVAERPYEERLWERLMLARYRIGNAAGALRAFQTVRSILGEQLGIEPGDRLRGLEERILLHDPSLGRPNAIPTPHNLPSSHTSFVGRSADAEGLVSLLEHHRLVTVTGGPGLGKTRLATEVGHRMVTEVPGGVWFARLVGATTESDVTATISAAMGILDDVSDPAQLGRAVAGRPQLLVLDNCEHVLDHVRRFVTACLDTNGPLRILATSRHRLGLLREQVWRIAPLGLPADGGRRVFESDAVRLLIDRAEAADRSFRGRETDPAQLAELCRRTDGIPLAIELAASWLPSIGVPDAMDLAGIPAPEAFDDIEPHHRSLRAAVDWSFALLAEADRAMVAAASVFRGSFTLDAVHDVCAPDRSRPDVAGVVSRLVESSLLSSERRPDGSMRYRMLEPVREYAHHSLDSEGRAAALHSRHAQWYLLRAEELGVVLGEEVAPAAALEPLDAELADHRAAMRELLDAGDHERAASLATALTGYWFARYQGWEAIQWLDEALAGPMADDIRVRALWTAGWAAYSRADYTTAAGRYEESRTLAVAGGDWEAEGWALFGLGRIELPRNPERGRVYLDQALELFSREPGMDRQRGECLVAAGFSAAMGGKVAEAVALLDEGGQIMDRCGSIRSLSICHRYLSLAAWYSDDRELAKHHVDLAEQLAREADDRPAIGGSLTQRSLVESRWGDLSRAAEAMIEALDQLPPRHEIDHCLVFVGAFPVLTATGHFDLADRLFDHVDRVYAEHGWRPVDERMPAMADIRAEVSRAVERRRWDPKSSAEMAQLLSPTLAALAEDS
jgi:predicted ATPase/DNA-binding SARP family transcriptional activator